MYFDDNYDGLTQVYLEHLHKYRLAVDERLFRNFMIVSLPRYMRRQLPVVYTHCPGLACSMISAPSGIPT